MAEYPALGRHPGTLPVISWFSHGALIGGSLNSGIVDAGWNSANSALLWVLQLTEPALITQLFWYNGATIAGNIDCGIYALDKGALTATRIVSTGATAQAGASAPQAVDITDTVIGPGEYLIAVAVSDAAATFRASAYSSNNNETQQVGVFRASSVMPLPATLILNGARGFPNGVYWCGALIYPRTVL